MKRIAAFLLTLIFVLGIAVTPAYAKDDSENIKSLLDSDAVSETFAEIGAAVNTGDGADVFMKVMDSYPVWVEQIRAIENDMPYSYTSDCPDKIDASIVEDVLNEPIIFGDFARLIEMCRTGDAGKIHLCVLEIYPDIVASFVSSIEKHNNSASGIGTVLSGGSGEILCAVAGIAVGFVAAWVIFRRKKKAVGSPSAEDETSVD